MEKIAISTTQNIDIEYEIAGVGDRLIAALIDLFILVGYLIFSFSLIGIFGIVGVEPGTIIFIVMYLPVFVYEVLFESLMNGQTLGKRIRGIRVLSLDGSEAGTGSFIIRWVFRFIEIYASFGSIALVTLILSKKGQRLGDMAAGTAVVKIRNSSSLDETILTNLDNNYTPLFPQASELDHSDVEIIKEVLNTRPEDDVHGTLRNELMRKTRKAIENKLKISSEIDNKSFLSSILKDYNYYKGRV